MGYVYSGYGYGHYDCVGEHMGMLDKVMVAMLWVSGAMLTKAMVATTMVVATLAAMDSIDILWNSILPCCCATPLEIHQKSIRNHILTMVPVARTMVAMSLVAMAMVVMALVAMAT